MTEVPETWLNQVKESLASINMPFDAWQEQWPYDFEADYHAGISANDSARHANAFWWDRQDEAFPPELRRRLAFPDE